METLGNNKHKRLIQSKELMQNIYKLCEKIENGFFNIIIIFGATRTGKSTLAMQIGQEMAHKLGVTFDVNNIHFDAELCMKDMQKGVKRSIHQLDEAAFNAKGVDWQDVVQKNLIKYVDTAAKYNQTLILLIPYIEELKYRFIRDEHTRICEITYNKTTFERGYAKLYAHYDGLMLHHYLKQRNMYKAHNVKYKAVRFTAETGFIDMQEYERKKDEAIANLGQESDKHVKGQRLGKKWHSRTATLAKYIYDNKIMTQEEIGKLIKLERNTISQLIDKNEDSLTI